MTQIDPKIAIKGSVVFPTVYSEGSTIDDNAIAGQKNVPVADTTKFTANDRVIIGRGTDREEQFTIDSVDTGVKIVSKTNLVYNHTIDANTTVDVESVDEPGLTDAEFLDDLNWVKDDWSGSLSGGFTHLTGTVEVVALNTAGADYTVDDELSLTQGENTTCEIKVTAVDEAGAITGYTITNKGYGYTIATGLSGAGGTGTGAEFDIIEINNETPLSHDHTPVIGKRYYISLTVANRTDGTFVLSFGGFTSSPISATSNFKKYATTTEPLVITPSKTFDGKITISIKEITKILLVTATTNFVVGEKVVVDEGGDHEVTYTIASIQSGISLTMVENLAFTHAVGETVTQTGTEDVVEVCMASLSEVIDKANYKDIVLFLPSTWTSASITFVSSITADGTFNEVVFADDVGAVTIASVAASKVITMNGEIRDALTGLPYIKLRSGTSAAPVDQGAGNVKVEYVLTR